MGITAIVVMLLIMFFTGNLNWLGAAGAGTGAADINARYWNGYDLDDTITTTGQWTFSSTSTLTNVDWANSDDGAGSGLDADLLDGSDSSAYTWPGDISCGSGFTDMGTYCIQTNDNATTTNWYSAQDYCHDNFGGARLCSLGEWYNACNNSKISGATDSKEWLDEWVSGTVAWSCGDDGSCTVCNHTYTASTQNLHFRCCK